MADLTFERFGGVNPFTVPEGARCSVCRQRRATHVWGTVHEINHGMATYRCEVCVLETQVEHAEERAAALPGLREKLEAAKRACPIEFEPSEP